MESYRGTIEKILFCNKESGYTVAQLVCEKEQDPITIVGSFSHVRPGESIRCTGEWKHHLIHGRQLSVAECQAIPPTDVFAIEKYLGSGWVHGIGKKFAKKIVDFFGKQTLEILENAPGRLEEIPGVGKKRVAQLKEAWEEQKGVRDVMLFLQGHEITPAFAQKIFRRFGHDAIKRVTEDPYCLARDVKGIGFKMADELAQRLGYGKESPQRIGAGILFFLQEFSKEGHTCYPLAPFIEKTALLLEISPEQLEMQLGSLREEKQVVIHPLVVHGKRELFIWLGSLYASEVGISKEIHRFVRGKSPLRTIDTKKAIVWVQECLHLKLAAQQEKAVSNAFEHKMQIITGGPGTGKSTITHAILTIAEQLTKTIVLVAPTGRAAKRMSEITKRPASTIHSLLEVEFGTNRFKKNRDNPLECDWILIDEASMMDTFLLYHLLRAIPSKARVIFIGDIFQLPSVGPGNVLKDLILSQRIPTISLTEIFRQAAGSQIITNAHRINQGQYLQVQNHAESDFFFLEEDDPEKIEQTLVQLVTQRLPQRYGLDPMREIQVLAPMRKGILGIYNLNDKLQERLNPQKHALHRPGMRLAKGDKVMQIRNNYNKEIFNGDLGFIKEIDTVEEKVWIAFDEQMIEYSYGDLDELVLAYAVSVHKYQGSEAPCIVMPIHTSHFKLSIAISFILLSHGGRGLSYWWVLQKL